MKRIISVSRRTDIPAFYGDWFMRRLREGFAGVVRWHGHLPEGTPYGAGRVHGLEGRATKMPVPLSQ